MFLYISNDFAEMLINLDNIANIVSRPAPRDSREVGSHEVGVFLENKHIPSPMSASPIWSGTYEVVFRGSHQDCNNFVKHISEQLPDVVEG